MPETRARGIPPRHLFSPTHTPGPKKNGGAALAEEGPVPDLPWSLVAAGSCGLLFLRESWQCCPGLLDGLGVLTAPVASCPSRDFLLAQKKQDVPKLILVSLLVLCECGKESVVLCRRGHVLSPVGHCSRTCRKEEVREGGHCFPRGETFWHPGSLHRSSSLHQAPGGPHQLPPAQLLPTGDQACGFGPENIQ